MSNSKSQDSISLYGIVPEDSSLEEEAKLLAEQLKIPVRSVADPAILESLHLRLDRNGLALQLKEQIMRGDFAGMQKRLRTGNLQREMLIKAARIKGISSPLVIDATAGMGEDSLILAAAGFRVKMYERHPVIAALLADALRRASEHPEFSIITGRLELFIEDSITAMKTLDNPPDVILLDPMFPERQKNSLVKKKFQLLHQLERPCEDEEQLLQTALAAHPRKIVIKRPLKGAFLAEKRPDYSLKGKAIRYDCFVLHRP